MKKAILIACLFCPSLGFAGDITITDAFVPMAPKGVMAHAAYMQVTNSGDASRSLIGVKAPDYAMAHIHQSMEKDGIATMMSMHQLDIKPGQTVVMEPGGLHIMLMKPSDPLELGGTVAFDLEFANGETMRVTANVVRRDGTS